MIIISEIIIKIQIKANPIITFFQVSLKPSEGYLLIKGVMIKLNKNVTTKHQNNIQ